MSTWKIRTSRRTDSSTATSRHSMSQWPSAPSLVGFCLFWISHSVGVHVTGNIGRIVIPVSWKSPFHNLHLHFLHSIVTDTCFNIILFYWDLGNRWIQPLWTVLPHKTPPLDLSELETGHIPYSQVRHEQSPSVLLQAQEHLEMQKRESEIWNNWQRLFRDQCVIGKQHLYFMSKAKTC